MMLLNCNYVVYKLELIAFGKYSIKKIKYLNWK